MKVSNRINEHETFALRRLITSKAADRYVCDNGQITEFNN